jgi:hypothetical protein
MGSSSYRRPHHQRVERMLQSFNHSLFFRTHCQFGGGTAMALFCLESTRRLRNALTVSREIRWSNANQFAPPIRLQGATLLR